MSQTSQKQYAPLGQGCSGSPARGVLLLGGKGTRVQAITNGRNKHLSFVGGATLAEHGLECLIRCGITRISVVCPQADLNKIRHLFSSAKWQVPEISYVVQPAPVGTADAVLRASRQSGAPNPTVVLFGDNLFELPQPHISQALRPPLLGELYLAQANEPRNFGVVQLKGDGAIADIQSKPRSPVSSIVCTGLMKFAPEAIDMLPGLAPNPSGELDLMDLARLLLQRGHLGWRWTRGWWKDVATDADTMAAACRPPDPDPAATP